MSTIPLRYNNFWQDRGTGVDYTIDLKSCSRQPGSYLDEICANAELIRSMTNDPIYIMYSGGIDSEFMFHCFMKLGINVRPVFIRLSPEYNNYDYHFVTELNKSRKIQIKIIDINFDDFVNSGRFAEIASKLSCHVHQYPALFDTALRLDGVVLIGDYEPHFALHNGIWMFDEYESQSVLNRFYQVYGVHGTPAFLNYTPETLLSFMNEEVIVDLVEGKFPTSIVGSNKVKPRIYHKYFNLQERVKKDGYEEIRQSKIYNHPDIQNFKKFRTSYSLPGNGVYTLNHIATREILEKDIK